MYALASAVMIVYLVQMIRGQDRASNSASSSADTPEADLPEAPSSEEPDAGRAACEADTEAEAGALDDEEKWPMRRSTASRTPPPRSPRRTSRRARAEAPDEPAPDPLQGEGELELVSEGPEEGERPPVRRYPGRLALSLFVQACFVVSVVAFDVGSMTRWTIITLSAVFAINAVRRYLSGR